MTRVIFIFPAGEALRVAQCLYGHGFQWGGSSYLDKSLQIHLNAAVHYDGVYMAEKKNANQFFFTEGSHHSKAFIEAGYVRVNSLKHFLSIVKKSI